MKIGKNRGWTLMDADIPDAGGLFSPSAFIRVHPRFEISRHRRGDAEKGNPA
jgi:hypothetical protein